MDVVRSVNESNLILPAGDVRIGPKDYNVYANSQIPVVDEINAMPIKTDKQDHMGESVFVGDVGKAVDSGQLQYNIVRVDGQHSVYIPILKQGGGSNTISIVNGIREAVKHLLDIPKTLKTAVVFDQSVFVKIAVKNVINEGSIGLCLTALMILLFLGNLRATISVLLSIPISCLAAFIALNLGASTINTMVLGGIALALSRLIDNSVVVLESIFRHMELGEPAVEAAINAGKAGELAGTCSTSIVFFPVIMLSGVSKYIFTALALAVVLALFASYAVAMTVVPLFCAKFIRLEPEHSVAPYSTQGGAREVVQAVEGDKRINIASIFRRIVITFNQQFERLQKAYEKAIAVCLDRPVLVVCGFAAFVALSFALFPFLGVAFFPRTDPGQFVVNVKVPPGTRLEVTDEYVGKMEQDVRDVVSPHDMNMIVSNIGITPDLSAIYTSNSGMHTAFIQVSLKEDHKTSSFAYMQHLRERLANDFPEVSTYFQTGGLVDSVVNQGQPAPIDIRIGGSDLDEPFAFARSVAARVKALSSVNDVLIPQDLDYPGLELNIDREHAALLGISPEAALDNVITALTSDTMIAPSFWVDPKTGNNYFLSVQYPDNQIKTLTDLKQIPLRAPGATSTTPLESLASIKQIDTPTEVDHYQLRRSFDIYVMPKKYDLGRVSA